MVAACPRCAARYRVDPERIGPAGARLRCARCEAVFRVRAAHANTPPLASLTQPDTTPTPAPTSAQSGGRALPGQSESIDRARLVLIADSDVEAGKHIAAVLAAWGLQPILVHDGVEAILTIQRMLPPVVLLDAALPKMFGFQVCEVVKRNESLRRTNVVLIGAIHHRDRYRRPPSEIYGADVYVERHDLPEGLVPLLQRFGLPVQPTAGATAAPAVPAEVVLERVAAEPQPSPIPRPQPAPVVQPPAPVAQPQPTPVVQPPAPVVQPQPAPVVQQAAPPAPQPAPSDPLDDERAKAERLARIIVSDIVLYNADLFASAVRAGNVLKALESALEEGRDLFRQRIDERVRAGRNFLEDELMRVAKERRGG